MKDQQPLSMKNASPSAVAGESGAGDTPPAAAWIDRLWKCGIIAVLYGVLFRDELLRLVGLWSTPRESHGMLIPLFSLYFIYQDRQRIASVAGKPNILGGILMLLTVVGYLVTVFKGFYYPRQLMMILMIGAIVLFLGGWRCVRLLWLPIGFLIFAMPLPEGIYYSITFPLRQLASDVASMILNLMPGVQCESAGVVIQGVHYADPFKLNVAEACSGMRLLMTFVALGVAMAYLEYRPIIHRVLLLVSTVPIAIFCNMLRVLITGLIHIYIGSEYATGTLHNFLGLIMLGVAFGLYGLLAWVMNRLYVDEKQDDGILVVGSKGGPTS